MTDFPKFSDLFFIQPGRIREVSVLGSAFFSFPWGRLLVTLGRKTQEALKRIKGNREQK